MPAQHYMTFLGIDVGTSFIKGAVLDLENLSLGEIHRVPFPEAIAGLPPLFHEVDSREIVPATESLINHCLARAADCQGIVVCGQMGGLVLTTEQGIALSNYISWQDKRLLATHPSGAGSYFDVMLEHFTAADWRQLGREVRPGLPVSFLFWLAENGKLPAEDIIAATLPEFVAANLCSSPPATHFTNAVGALNLEMLNWHHPLFGKLGLGSVRWPQLRDMREPVGHLQLGSASLPCYAPVGDHPCALAGAGLRFGELSLNISTGSQVSLLTPRLELGDFQTRPFFDGQFLNTVTNLPAGRALNVLISLLTEVAGAQGVVLQDPWSYITHAAEQVIANDLRADLAFFPSPVGDAGSVANIREGNLTVGHLFRAAFENMAENYFASALRLSPQQMWRSLVFSGGLAQKIGLLRRVIGEKFKREFRDCSTSEDTLQGLLVLALVASGKTSSVGAAMNLVRIQ